MVDNNVTVDELAIEVSANADSAAASIGNLTDSLDRLVATLEPVQGLLARVTKMLQASKGATPALRAALDKASGGADKLTESVERSRDRIEKLSAAYRHMADAAKDDPSVGTTQLEQMRSIIGSIRTEIKNLKTDARHIISPAEFSQMDSALEKMRREAEQLRATLHTATAQTSDRTSRLLGTSGIGAKSRGSSSSPATTALTKFAANADTIRVMLNEFDASSSAATLQMKELEGRVRSLGTQLKTVRETMGKTFDPNLVKSLETEVVSLQGKLAALKAETLTAARQSLLGTLAAVANQKATAAPPVSGLSKLRGIADSVREKIGGVTASLATMGKSGSKSVQTLGGSFIQLRSSIFFAFFAIGFLVRAFQSVVGRASAFYETLNLFEVSFGNLSETAAKWVSSLTSKLGLDPAQFAKTAATFQEMNQAMGIGSELALQMSKNLTQLSYDYASLFDISFEQSAEKFRSAMAGQTRAVRTFGLDVTIAALQDEIYAEGLNYKISQLNRASKAVLIHNILLRNSTRAQGDLARTLSSPANMMRVLADQVRVAALSIGYLFIPILRAVLPWLITLAQALNAAARAFAGLFGIKVPAWESFTASVGSIGGGVEDIYDGMDKVGDATGKAADAAKRLRDYTLGIDELNILSPETPTAGGGEGGGGGGGGGGGIAPGIKPFNVYDMIGGIDALKKITEPVKAAFDSVMKALAPFIGAVKRLWKALLPFAKNVWTGFTDFWKNVLIPLGVWTMNTAGVFLLERLTDILNWFNEHPDVAKLIGAALAAFTALKGLDVFIGTVKKLGGVLTGVFGIKFLGGLAANIATFMSLFTGGDITTRIGLFFASLGSGTGILGSLSYALGISVGWIVAIIAAVVGAAIVIIKNWDKIKAAAKALWKGIEPLRKVFRETASVLTRSMGPAFAAIRRASEQMWAALRSVGEIIWRNLKPAFDVVVGVVKVVASILISAFVANLRTTIGVVNGLARAIGPLVQAIAGIAEVVYSTFNLIVGVVTGDMDKIRKSIQGFGAGVRDIMDGSTGAVKGFVSGVRTGTAGVDAALAGTKKSFSEVNWNTKEAARTTDGFTWSIRDATGAVEDATSGVQDYADKIRGLNDASYDVVIAEIEKKEAYSKLKDSINQTKDKTIKYTEAMRAIKDNKLLEYIREHKGLTDDQKRALIDAAKATDRSREANKKYAETFNVTKPLNQLDRLIKKYKALQRETVGAYLANYALTHGGKMPPEGSRIPGTQLMLARGGMPPVGSVYIAGEAGPELIGSFGGNPNTVMPLENSGFVEAMHDAVFAAVARGISGLSVGGDGDVYLDGEKVGRVLDKRKRHSGVGLSLVTAGGR